MQKKTTLKLALGLFGIAMAGTVIAVFLLFTLAGLLGKSWGNALFVILNLLIYLPLIYSTAWREGYRDPNRVKYGHMEKFMPKGLIAGLIASIPFVIVYLLLVFSAIAQWHYDLFRFIFVAFELPFASLINHFDTTAPLSMFLLPLPVLACAGYLMGYRQIAIMHRIVYKKKKPDDKKKKI